MEMKGFRRPFDGSRVEPPVVKKARLAEDSAPDFVQQWPMVSASVSSRFQFSDTESSDSVRGPYPQQQDHHELVRQYKMALAELTFYSKPIITNLTIIAGENLIAARAIAATICTNILEVPSEQKLPSLYLLDSIVKNIGRDYIKHLLPGFLRQVDPSIHHGMQHLFGTWKGVFPPQTLQLIEKDLGFTPVVNASTSGTTSRNESQSARPAHSIHVNPKYLGARQRMQQSTRTNGTVGGVSGTLISSSEDVESLDRTASVNSSHKPWHDSASRITGIVPNKRSGYDLKHGIQNYSSHESASHNARLHATQDFTNRSRSWKNSEEEEYMWDDITSRLPHATGRLEKDHWALDDSQTVDLESQLQRSQSIREIGPSFDSDTSTDSISTEHKRQAAFGHPVSSPWSREPHSFSGLSTAANSIGRTPFQSTIHPLSPSPSLPTHSSSQMSRKVGDLEQTHAISRVDPRTSQFPRSTLDPRHKFYQEYQPTLSRNTHLDISQIAQPPGFPNSSSTNGSVSPPLPSCSSPTQLMSSGTITIPSSVSSEPLRSPNVVNSGSNPVSSLINNLVAKGLITASKTESATAVLSQIPNRSPPNVRKVVVSSVPVSLISSPSSTAEEKSLSKSATKTSDASAKSATREIKNLIGLMFKPDVIRQPHPVVISELLDDIPHQCGTCGLRLKFKEKLDRHLDWHESRNLDMKLLNNASRKWYMKSAEWVAGNCSSSNVSSKKIECSEQMVLADEGQCACILCGELFEDVFSEERDRWMFKGAVYMSIQSLGDDCGRTNKKGISLGPIVHKNCISETSLHDLGLVRDVKQEKDV